MHRNGSDMMIVSNFMMGVMGVLVVMMIMMRALSMVMMMMVMFVIMVGMTASSMSLAVTMFRAVMSTVRLIDTSN